jgi:hypothetical protein
MNVKGSASAIKALGKRIAAMPANATRSLPSAIASELSTLAQSAFDAGMTADGISRPTGARGPVSLVQSGALRASIQFQASGQTVVCTLAPQAQYLSRFGILPSGGLPSAWSQAANAVTVQALEAASNAV